VCEREREREREREGGRKREREMLGGEDNLVGNHVYIF
jgi:hypothetical protein